MKAKMQILIELQMPKAEYVVLALPAFQPSLNVGEEP